MARIQRNRHVTVNGGGTCVINDSLSGDRKRLDFDIYNMHAADGSGHDLLFNAGCLCPTCRSLAY